IVSKEKDNSDPLDDGKRITGALMPLPITEFDNPPALLANATELLKIPAVAGEKTTGMFVASSGARSKAMLVTRFEAGFRIAKGPPVTVAVTFKSAAPELLTANIEEAE